MRHDFTFPFAERYLFSLSRKFTNNFVCAQEKRKKDAFLADEDGGGGNEKKGSPYTGLECFESGEFASAKRVAKW